jgi:hypothetical protein
MSHNNSTHMLEGNETAKWGKDQNWAVIWFLLVLVLGTIFVSFLTKIDSWMYHNEGRVEVLGVKLFDDEKYAANRKAGFSIPSERSDDRARGSLSHAYKELNVEGKK